MLATRLCVCPACHAPLASNGAAASPTTDELRCSGGHLFPVVDGVPVLLEDAAPYLAAVARQYEQAIQRSDALTAKAKLAEGDPELAFRKPVMNRIAAASERRSAFLRSQHAPVAAWLKERATSTATAAPGALDGDLMLESRYGPSALNYLRGDWSGEADCEQQIHAVESALLPQAERYADPSGGAVVLGAGAGRILFDLARHFDTIVGVDMSFPFVHGFRCLERSPVAASLIELVAPYSRDQIVLDFTAQLPADRTPLERLTFPVADALALPLADASVATVVMTFFADVVPLPLLLEEIGRVLKPGGRVLSVGTLNYHFANFTWFLAPEEAEEIIAKSGFAFEEQSWSDMPFFEHPSSFRRTCRVWSYVLTKK